MLLQYPWPGNVRELENVMRRAVVLCTDHHITPAHLMFDDWLTHSMAAPHEQASLDAPDVEAAAPAWPAAMPVTMPTSPESMAPSVTHVTASAEPPVDLQSAVRLNEHQVIMATLASTPSKTEAAKRLGISPRTLRYKMAQLREHGMNMAAAC
jgi:two-component system response regulator FlrC